MIMSYFSELIERIIKMIILICLLFIPSSIVLAQTSTYTAYQSSFTFATSCPTAQYFDTALMRCSPCPANAIQKLTDFTQCDCANNSFYYAVNQGGGSLICSPCNTSYVRSIDGFGCTQPTVPCDSFGSFNVLAQADIQGNLFSGTITSSSASQPRIGSDSCIPCKSGTQPDPAGQRCTPCASITPWASTPSGSIICCTANNTYDGMCLLNVPQVSLVTFNTLNVFNTPTASVFFNQHLVAAFYLCRMNLSPTILQLATRTLLSNATACQVLANIATMQFFYNGNGYAYNIYDTYIWGAQSVTQIWQVSNNRTSIPFLQYPLSYYNEINSATYNWISATFYQNDVVQLKFAKYSVTGEYLGLFDAADTYIQLCGGGYTNGRAAFTFGTQYQRSCNIRADVLWNSSVYETAFFDPYIAFTQSGSLYLLPTPVVVQNYRSTAGTYPNQNADQSSWTYHRRFFLLDRTSGITGNNTLTNIHYAKSIKILNQLTNGGATIQPPIVFVEYGELYSSDIGKGTIVQVSFESDYQMNLDSHIQGIWIAIGVMSGLGLILAFVRTSIWQGRAGRDVIDLATIGKFFIYTFNVVGTVFFIVMAGVSLWWLIFFKRQDAIYLVLPISVQQVSFTALICVSFVLKTIDILHLIFRQSDKDIFFLDWEKPKAGNPNTVSVWRTYFVANEYHEIQTFRRINLTFQLFFVLFLLKVINLENVATAQPGVNLFPSSADYTPGYNAILRVGIAFSMWLATALVQYLLYVLFYRRFVEDRILNFIDLCSVSNISVFILTDNLHGYYIHGRSPHGTTDVNMRDMLINLEREGKQMSGTRGLQAKSDEQTFIMRIDRGFRAQYEVLLRNYQNRILTHSTKTDEHESEILMASYRNLNEFLCAFIDHSLPNYQYIIRDRNLVEKLLNYEFQLVSPTGPSGHVDSTFFVDKEKSFMNALFAGHEHSLFLWNMATFLFIDYFAFNYVLAAVITYILNLIANKMRLSLGRRNLSAKTLIPKEFLI